MRRIKIFLSMMTLVACLGVSGMSAVQAAPVSLVALQGQSDACSGLNQLGGPSCDKSGSTPGQNSIANLVRTIVNIISFIAGITAVILIVISGLRFMLSGGDSQGAASARNMLIYAIVGLAIVALSQAIVHFVLNAIISNDVSQSGP